MSSNIDSTAGLKFKCDNYPNVKTIGELILLDFFKAFKGTVLFRITFGQNRAIIGFYKRRILEFVREFVREEKLRAW